uniref:Peptidase M10 serralysin C-terminal domain-containing protein n=1 Tax=OCS116 cluster bacterium TaxID=2030921 RepID=A0A2A4YPC8_9PROT
MKTDIEATDGGAGDDAISGVINSTAASSTYQAGDVVNGSDGKDTLNVTVVNNTLSGNVLAEVKNVETISIHNLAGAAFTFDAANVTGAETLVNDRSNSDLTFDNVQNITAISLNDADGNTDVQFTDTVVAGTADELVVMTKDSGSSATDADLDVGNQTAIGTDAFEAVKISAEGSNFLDIAGLGSAVKTITIDGAGKLDLAAIDTTVLTKIDASGNTGGVTLDLADAAVLEVIGGTGDDTFVMTGTYSSADTITGGDGTDTLSIEVAQAAPAAVQTKVTGIEALTISDAANNTAVDTAKFGVTKKLTFDAVSPGTGGALTIAGLVSGSTIVTGKLVDDFGGTTAVDVNLSDAAGAGDSITIDIDNTAGAGNFDIDLDGVEVISIDASGSDKANAVDIDSAQVTTYTVNAGGGDLTLTTTTGGTAVTSVDASSTTGAGALIVTLSGAAIAGATVTGTKNDDTVNGSNQDDIIIGGAGIDTIDGSAGADTITGGAGVDALTGGAGADKFIFATADLDTTAGAVTDVIADFLTGGADKIDTTGAAGSATNYVEAGAAAANIAALLTAADAALTGAVTYYVGEVGANAFLVTDFDGNGYTDVIQLTGNSLATIAFGDIA